MDHAKTVTISYSLVVTIIYNLNILSRQRRQIFKTRAAERKQAEMRFKKWDGSIKNDSL